MSLDCGWESKVGLQKISCVFNQQTGDFEKQSYCFNEMQSKVIILNR